jgi:RNA polymerase sigma-70 factor (ECF subfamily)
MSNQEEDDSMAALSDSLLIQRVKSGDISSFELLFHRHYDRVYGLLFRLLGNRDEAEDITQEVFLKLYRQPLSGNKEHNVGGWLYRVATNMAYNHIRSRTRLWRRNRWLLPDETDSTVDPSAQAALEETKAGVRAALSQLSQRQTQLLILREMGMSYAELAEVCEVSPGSIGTLLARAAEAFRQVYEEESDSQP